MLPFTASSIFDRVRVLNNDKDGAVYTDSAIIDVLNISFDDIRGELEDYNIPIVNRTSDPITVTAGVLGIGGDSEPALPPDLIEPLSLYERLTSTNDQYMLMQRRQFLPEINTQTTYLQYWSVEDDKIKFIGATSNLDVKMHYIAYPFMADVKGAGYVVKKAALRNFLSFRTAALCADFIMENETRADKLNKNAERCLDTFLSTAIKPQQSIVTRRRPFMGRYKQSGGRYNW